MAGKSRRTTLCVTSVLMTIVVTLAGFTQLAGGRRIANAQAATPTTLAATPAAGNQVKYKKVNVELILDSSGSMAEELEGGQTRIDAAKQVLNQVIDALPVQEGINVGFRVYGHKGNNNESG
ncbi:MAG TPA: hypothetical protein VH482_24345, partial [Thermomicrobiales bacterium]